MKAYYRIMPGRGSMHVDECRRDGFVGVDFGIEQDLSNELPDNWRDFNQKYVPVYLENRPEKSKMAAGLACGSIWTVSKGMQVGDVVLSPDGTGKYLTGEVTGDYFYRPGEILPHRRPVRWFDATIERAAMSAELRNSAGGPGTHARISQYADEIEALLQGSRPPQIISSDESIEDPAVFVLEKHLEDFLVQNWQQTEFGKLYDIFEVDGELVGQQFEVDTGRIDILAISKDRKEILVVELKKGRASDAVVGQIQRYMGYVMAELAEPNQTVKGVIVALTDDLRIRRALAVAQNIEFYTYEISFRLNKA